MNQFTITTQNKETLSVFSNYCGAQQQKLTIDTHTTQQHLRDLLTEEGHVVTADVRGLKEQKAMTGRRTEGCNKQRVKWMLTNI